MNTPLMQNFEILQLIGELLYLGKAIFYKHMCILVGKHETYGVIITAAVVVTKLQLPHKL